MAWIKVEHVTPDKPEVVAMALDLGIDQDAVSGKLIRLWIWADQQSLNGHALSVTEMFLDRVSCHAGFAKAMRKVGWLTGENGAITFPKFDRHNGETAKARALASKRQVTKRSRAQRDKSVTRVEQSRVGRLVGRKGKFSSLKKVETKHLDSTAAICGIHRSLSAEHPDLIASDEDSLTAIQGAAIRALQRGNKPLEMFCGIVRHQSWENITGDQRAKAREKLKEHRAWIASEQQAGREVPESAVPLPDKME